MHEARLSKKAVFVVVVECAGAPKQWCRPFGRHPRALGSAPPTSLSASSPSDPSGIRHGGSIMDPVVLWSPPCIREARRLGARERKSRPAKSSSPAVRENWENRLCRGGTPCVEEWFVNRCRSCNPYREPPDAETRACSVSRCSRTDRPQPQPRNIRGDSSPLPTLLHPDGTLIVSCLSQRPDD